MRRSGIRWAVEWWRQAGGIPADGVACLPGTAGQGQEGA